MPDECPAHSATAPSLHCAEQDTLSGTPHRFWPFIFHPLLILSILQWPVSHEHNHRDSKVSRWDQGLGTDVGCEVGVARKSEGLPATVEGDNLCIDTSVPSEESKSRFSALIHMGTPFQNQWASFEPIQTRKYVSVDNGEWASMQLNVSEFFSKPTPTPTSATALQNTSSSATYEMEIKESHGKNIGHTNTSM